MHVSKATGCTRLLVCGAILDSELAFEAAIVHKHRKDTFARSNWIDNEPPRNRPKDMTMTWIKRTVILGEVLSFRDHTD